MLKKTIDLIIPPILKPSVFYRIINYLIRGNDKFSMKKIYLKDNHL